MEKGLQLEKIDGLNRITDFSWELHFVSSDIDPKHIWRTLAISYPYTKKDAPVRFKELIRAYLNKNEPFFFEYSPSDNDHLYLSFKVDTTMTLKYHFTYHQDTMIWNSPCSTEPQMHCVEKSISGSILNPLDILLEWPT